jgi:protein disulfide-isomerase A6
MIAELDYKKFKVRNSNVYVDIKGPGMLLVWAKWCGHCHNFLPTYAKLDEKLNGGFTLASIEESSFGPDSTLPNTLGIRGFPTIKFFDEQGKIVSDYSGGRDMPTLLAYICKFYHQCSL